MALADEIERLYQLTPSEFTAARNAAAAQLKAPADKAAIRALQKPSTPAWAVNQLYWKRRKVFQQVLDAARKVRDAHAQQLAGRFADVQSAERHQSETLKKAADEIRDLLRSGGEKETPATMNAVLETLQALPGREDHGRLVKPLKPLGFEALAGLMPRGGATIARLAEARPLFAPAAVQAPGPAKRGAPAPDKAAMQQARRREIAAQQKAVAAVERELRKAAVAEREAKADQSRAEMTLARVQRERKDLQTRLDELTVRRDELAVEFDQRRKDLERASAERERLESRVRSMRSPGS
jgi:hypothetical protein